jgi:hypothetical protein
MRVGNRDFVWEFLRASCMAWPNQTRTRVAWELISSNCLRISSIQELHSSGDCHGIVAYELTSKVSNESFFNSFSTSTCKSCTIIFKQFVPEIISFTLMDTTCYHDQIYDSIITWQLASENACVHNFHVSAIQRCMKVRVSMIVSLTVVDLWHGMPIIRISTFHFC